jgi:sulfatase maturation enzyme AslB (radical SAM superfamily)
MSFKDTFCPSPWFHTRINNSGNYEYCRWAVKHDRQGLPSITTQSPVYWFQHGMSGIRKQLLAGEQPEGCSECYQVEKHGKVSGRQRQLLKIGVTVDNFEKTMLSTPWLQEFKNTKDRDGATDQLPQDWQIDLGNFCNSACLFCEPHSSSRLASEFKRIGFIKELPPTAWVDNPENIEMFVDMLERTPKLAYLHFIGGETLITPAFRKILQALIDNDLCKEISIGFTTNLTTWDSEIVKLLCEFKQVNLGMSVECLHPANDYARYGSNLATVERMMKRWIDVARQQGWLTQIRITPTILTVLHLDSIYRFAMAEGLAVESCNFLNDPAFMRPSVLPPQYRAQVIDRLQAWIDQQVPGAKDQIVNTRDPNQAATQVLQDAMSYVEYFRNEPDESHRLPDLIDYLKIMEQSRKNSVLDYLPEYEELFRSAGY